MHQLEEATDVTGGPTLEKLLQWKLSLNEKLQKLKLLDNEILALVNDDGIEEEIEQADVFSERLHQSIISVDQLIASRSSVSTTTGRSLSTPRTTETTAATETAIETTTDTPTGRRTPPTEDDVPIVSDAHCRVKLPKLVPKTFNGDLTK